MKKLILTTTLLLIAATTQAADVFTTYQEQGRTALASAQKPNADQTLVISQIQLMIQSGYQIMDLYLTKYPECTEQFNQLKAVDSELINMSYDKIDSLYHEGEGLVKAPRACYKGRSLVVHPYQVIALAKENKLQTQAKEVEHEMNEVIERAGKFKTDLKM